MKKNLLCTLIPMVLTFVAVDAFALEINPRGRVHVDYALHDDDASDLGDKFRVRRARIGLSGKIDDDWSFQIEYDFAENSSEARDVYLRYGGWSAGSLTIGHFKVPFGLEELTSSNDITFIERSLPITTFAQSRRLGVGYETSGSNWQFQAMGFGQGSGSAVRSDDSADEGLGVGARFVFNPIMDDRRVLHLGIAATIEEPENSNAELVRFRTRPESRPTGRRLVDTGNISEVDNISNVGLEAGYRHGPFSLQGEWIRTDVSRNGGFSDADFSGWYIGSSYVFGGQRGYRGGRFRGVSPSGAGGAWELTARWSYVDLDDGLIEGGDQRNITLGVNWYANSRVRFMANGIFVDSERRGIDDDPFILLMRAQVVF